MKDFYLWLTFSKRILKQKIMLLIGLRSFDGLLACAWYTCSEISRIQGQKAPFEGPCLKFKQTAKRPKTTTERCKMASNFKAAPFVVILCLGVLPQCRYWGAFTCQCPGVQGLAMWPCSLLLLEQLNTCSLSILN